MDIKELANELDLLIFDYTDLIDEIDFSDNNVFEVLFNKLITNLTCANALLKEEAIKEAKIILRSSLETVVLAAYLSIYPEKIIDYKLDSQLLGFKNFFVCYKEFSSYSALELANYVPNIYSIDDLKKEMDEVYEQLVPENKGKLGNLYYKQIELNEQQIKNLDKFFIQKYKPFFMDLKFMYDELKEKKVAEVINLRDLIFNFYNSFSQITHGRYHDWYQNNDKDYEIHTLFSTIQRIIVVSLDYYRRYKQIDSDSAHYKNILNRILVLDNKIYEEELSPSQN